MQHIINGSFDTFSEIHSVQQHFLSYTIIVILTFLQFRKKWNCGNQLIHMCLVKIKSIGIGEYTSGQDPK